MFPAEIISSKRPRAAEFKEKNLSRGILVSKEEFRNRKDQYGVIKRTSLLPFFLNCCFSRLGFWSGPSNTKTKNSLCENFEHINHYYHFFFHDTKWSAVFRVTSENYMCLQFTVYIFSVGYYPCQVRSLNGYQFFFTIHPSWHRRLVRGLRCVRSWVRSPVTPHPSVSTFLFCIHANSPGLFGSFPNWYGTDLSLSCTGHHISRIKSSFELLCALLFEI